MSILSALAGWRGYAAAAAIAGAVIGIGVGTAQKWRYEAQIASINSANATQLKAISDAAQLATAAALQRQQQAESALAAADQQHSQEQANAQAQIDTLRRAVAAGTQRLRVQATCPATGGAQVPGAAPSGSVGDAAGPALTADAQRDYFALRDGIASATAMIGYLQDYARACQAHGE